MDIGTSFYFVEMVVVSLLFHLAPYSEATITGWTNDTETISGNDVTFHVTVAEDIADTDPIMALEATTSDTIFGHVISAPHDTTFEYNSGNIKLKTGKNLDRESNAIIVILVTAADTGGGQGTATVSIIITDVNDVIPTFSTPARAQSYLVIGHGTQVNSSVFNVTATDGDVSENTITYSIDSGNTNDDFSIGSTSGEIIAVNTLDIDVTSDYELVIMAKDAGTNPGQKTGSVTLNVILWRLECNSGVEQGAPLMAIVFSVLLLVLIF